MSESKRQWTPGPWELAPWGDLIGSNGDKVVFAGDGFSIGSRSNSTWKANGDVAKVAPELAEALQAMCSQWESICDIKGWDVQASAEYRAARAALAKAGA
ncbi:hypothetical protein [Burkholderia gladioli]|uniref:Uncharacterized protein n=1 Tax=Burkholderia gladioli TaxID=28095 RepID=A0AB38U5U1_BURGA|nr:hypothetical protein [Burkholderia gladioli]UWX68855.1 hypothetical protein NYZ96_11460 [Burkholderia gladioli]UWX75341.1 hypothetical protein NYZ96_35250 [Burkholderia gladioli]